MSSHRPVIGYHLIITCYGFWLPNDPRGSGSSEVWFEVLKPFGPATKVNSQRSVAHVPHDREVRRAAKRALQYPAIRFTGLQARAVARGFADYLSRYSIICHACAVMPDHAHLVLTHTERPIERIAVGLKAASVHALLSEVLHHDQHSTESARRKVWARGQRHLFLFEPFEIRRDIKYVQDNPVEWGLPRQHWRFVQTYVEPRAKRAFVFRKTLAPFVAQRRQITSLNILRSAPVTMDDLPHHRDRVAFLGRARESSLKTAETPLHRIHLTNVLNPPAMRPKMGVVTPTALAVSR